MERRVLRGLLMTGYVILFAGVVSFPALLFGGPNGLLLLIAISLGIAVGIAFGADPIGTEYRVLPMVFTTVNGRQFVGGSLLAATVVGVPLVTAVVVPLGLVSVVGTVPTILVAVVGVAVCTCTASVALAIGMGIERFDYAPISFFFTDIPVFAETGLRGFLRLGSIFAVVSLATVPAFVGNAPFVYQRLTAFGVPVAAVRIGSLLLTVLVLAAVTKIAFRIAVTRFRDYQIG